MCHQRETSPARLTCLSASIEITIGVAMRSHSQTDMTNDSSPTSTSPSYRIRQRKHPYSVKLRPHIVHITCQCITLNGKSWSEESWLPLAILLRLVRGGERSVPPIWHSNRVLLRVHCAAKLVDPQPKDLVLVRSSAHWGPQQRMAEQPATADWDMELLP